MSYIYLASPYTHADSAVMQHRYELVRAATAHLLSNRRWVYSPIVHCHDLAVHHNLPKEWDFWYDYDCVMLSKARILYVLLLGGWTDSKGVRGEIEFAKAHAIPYTGFTGDPKFETIPLRVY